MKGKRWSGNEGKQWSNKRHEERWFPNSIEDFLVSTIEDSTSVESTSIFFEYNDNISKVRRIKNKGILSTKNILVRIRSKKGNSSWTREYVISPNKDGKDYSIIDLNMAVSNFLLILDEGKLIPEYETVISIKVEDT